MPEDWLREGRIKIVIRLSPTLVPGMDRDIPWGGDLVRNADERQIYDFLVAPERLGRLFMVAGRVPAERTAALRTAFDAMVADPEFGPTLKDEIAGDAHDRRGGRAPRRGALRHARRHRREAEAITGE